MPRFNHDKAEWDKAIKETVETQMLIETSRDRALARAVADELREMIPEKGVWTLIRKYEEERRQLWAFLYMGDPDTRVWTRAHGREDLLATVIADLYELLN